MKHTLILPNCLMEDIYANTKRMIILQMLREFEEDQERQKLWVRELENKSSTSQRLPYMMIKQNGIVSQFPIEYIKYTWSLGKSWPLYSVYIVWYSPS